MSDNFLPEAACVHIYTAKARSGISAYAADFQEEVLGPEGYVQADPAAVVAHIGQFAPSTRFHIQLGVFQHQERAAMSKLLKAGYKNVEATLHDPPFTSFPYFQFSSKWLMRFSRGFDWYLSSFGIQRRALERMRRIFVLSERGAAVLKRMAPAAKVVTFPHFLKSADVWAPGAPLPPALMYFGFIGPNKGLDYVFELHRAVKRIRPGTCLHVVGQANGAEAKNYLSRLRSSCGNDVLFHGYVPDEELDNIFAKCANVILPYMEYQYIMPASGSIVQALRRARLVWVREANAVNEMIHDGDNGFILSMDAAVDANRLTELMASPNSVRKISEAARQSAIAMSNYPFRTHFAEAPKKHLANQLKDRV